MKAFHRSLVFAVVLAIELVGAKHCPADVMPRMPQNIVISKMDEHGDLLFFFVADGQIVKGPPLDPKSADQAGYVQVPSKGLPTGKLALLGVPRALAEKNRNEADPAWLTDGPPGVVLVAGVIHHYHVQKAETLHPYQLDKTATGLELTLSNSDVLTPYPAEDLSPGRNSDTDYTWLGLAGGIVVVLAGVLIWSLVRRRTSGGPGV
jgi:hypothetical protein